MLKKNLLIFFISLITSVLISGCSLFKSDTGEDGAEPAVVAEEGMPDEALSDSADLGDDIDFGAEAGEIATDGFATEESSGEVVSFEEEVVDEYPDDDYGMAASDLGSTGEGLPEDTLETNQEETLFIGAEDGASPQTLADSGFQEMDEPVATEPENDFMMAESDTESYATEPEPIAPVQDYYEPESVGFVSVKKMKHTPYMRAGSNINRLYIVRDGDTMSSIAQKIYGDSGRSSDLYAWNSHFQGKAINVGDKIYYSSPRNPGDTNQILTYYEDVGVPAQYYSAKPGEGTHKLSKKLLGHPRSWMEVWATNENLEQQEKWTIANDTQIRYWPAGDIAPTMAVAQNNVPPPEPEPTVEEPPAPEPMNVAQPSMQDPAPMDDGGMEAGMPEEQEALAAAEEQIPPPTEDIPPPDEFAEESDGIAGQVATMDEPPPPPSEPVAPPPPPPPQPVAPPEPPTGVEGIASMLNGKDDSMMMAVLGGLLILAALILLIFIRRGRKKVKYS